IAEGGPRLPDRDPGSGGRKSAGLEGTPYGRGQQGCRHPIDQRPLRQQDFRVAGQPASVGLQQLQLFCSDVDGAEARHWILSQVTSGLAFSSVTSAVSVRFVPVAVTVTFQLAPFPLQGLPLAIPTLSVMGPPG